MYFMGGLKHNVWQRVVFSGRKVSICIIKQSKKCVFDEWEGWEGLWFRGWLTLAKCSANPQYRPFFSSFCSFHPTR
jgi:hypothetical protein